MAYDRLAAAVSRQIGCKKPKSVLKAVSPPFCTLKWSIKSGVSNYRGS